MGFALIWLRFFQAMGMVRLYPILPCPGQLQRL
jgi:hypothetical protein